MLTLSKLATLPWFPVRRHNFPFWLQTAVSNFSILIKMSVWTPSHPPGNPQKTSMKRLVSLFLLAPLAILNSDDERQRPKGL